VRHVYRSEFLPSINTSRKLIKENNEGLAPSHSNPFKIEKKLERVLILGERDRELDKLESNMFKLKQKQASGEVFITNLARKPLSNRVDRSGIVNDVK
jgi:hypothetical protein